MKALHILLADDHELILSGLKAILDGEPGWKVVGMAKNGIEAVQMAGTLCPHVAVLDISMPDLNGIEATRQIRRASPATEVLILTMHNSEVIVRDVLEAGTKGFILKTDTNRLLKTAIESLAAHQTFFTGTASDAILQGYLDPSTKPGEVETHKRLSPREREVIQLLAEAHSSKDAAAKLGISVKTIEAHRSNIMRKLNLHSVAQLVRYAIRNEIIHP
ncbi:MAG: response regulator transcription factor [Verrucomicrobiae bacterium]